MGISVEQAQQILDDNVAPWVRGLNMTVETVSEGAVAIRLPYDRRLDHSGGFVCGQALMAIADASMLVAIANESADLAPRATVSLNISFMRPAAETDVIADVRILKSGRTLAFGDITLYGKDLSRPLARVAVTYAVGARAG